MTPAELLQSSSAQHLKNKSFNIIVIVIVIHNNVTCVNNIILVLIFVIVHIFAKIVNKSLLLNASRIGFIRIFIFIVIHKIIASVIFITFVIAVIITISVGMIIVYSGAKIRNKPHRRLQK